MAKYCANCGQELVGKEKYCPHCGHAIDRDNDMNHSGNPSGRSKIAAGLLGIFLGVFGIHNFYLGNTNRGMTQLLLGTIGVLLCGMGPVASSIWGFIEGILILTGSIREDGDGNPLND